MPAYKSTTSPSQNSAGWSSVAASICNFSPAIGVFSLGNTAPGSTTWSVTRRVSCPGGETSSADSPSFIAPIPAEGLGGRGPVLHVIHVPVPRSPPQFLFCALASPPLAVRDLLWLPQGVTGWLVVLHVFSRGVG